MRDYNTKITLIKNFRGVYDLDTSKGCYNGMKNNKKGCYNECYAYKFANQYGYNFNKTTLRTFTDIKHIENIRNKLYNIDMPFFRIGVSGDPSENWKHTLNIINLVSRIKPIVLITKHWNILTHSQLKEISKYNICINTSLSALDTTKHIKIRLMQYERIKDYCKSILRVVTCKFNTNNLRGLYLENIQKELLNNEKVIDNVLRVCLNNKLVQMNIIKVKKEKFINSDAYFSKSNDNTYTSICKNCKEMCGINI